MAGSDIFAGMMVNRFWDNRAQNQGAPDWAQVATKLKTRLANSEENVFFEQVKLDATNYVLTLALAALKESNPSSPLLNQVNRDQLRKQHMGEALTRKGYHFDMLTGKVTSKVS